MKKYRLKDEGYPTFKKICCGRDVVGRVLKNADGSFTARIGKKIEAKAATEADAFREAIATLHGLDISEISHDVLHMKKVQEQTETILAWLKDNCVVNDGKLKFSNSDLALAIGKNKPDRPLGNLISRLDFACYLCGLPSLGCAADKTFAGAWQRQEGYNRTWDFPVDRMSHVAKSRHWSPSDFDRIRHETQRLTTGMGHLAWKEEFAKHEAKIRAWAEA